MLRLGSVNRFSTRVTGI